MEVRLSNSSLTSNAQAAWPSGLRRQFQVLVRKGTSSNLVAVISFFRLATFEGEEESDDEFTRSGSIKGYGSCLIKDGIPMKNYIY